MFAPFEFGGDVRISRRRHEGRKPIEARHDRVLDLAGRHQRTIQGTPKPPSKAVPFKRLFRCG
jgi:hypothetical protein